MSGNWYDPEHERTCRGCYKKLKTKEGILEASSFTCQECHKYYKVRDWWILGSFLAVIILLWGVYFWLSYKIKGLKAHYFLKKEEIQK